MPVALTLPLGLERKPRVRQRRLKRLAIGALILGAAVLAAGFWLPAKGELAQRPSRASTRASESAPATVLEPAALSGRVQARQLAALEVGDDVALRAPDGSTHAYEVAALDVVDGNRAEFPLDIGSGVAVLVTGWPLDDVPPAGRWRYVVTLRRDMAAAPLVTARREF